MKYRVECWACDGSRVRSVSAEHIGVWLSCATLPLTICLALVEWRIAHGGA